MSGVLILTQVGVSGRTAQVLRRREKRMKANGG